MWDLPGSGVKSVPPALAGGFLSTATREVQEGLALDLSCAAATQGLPVSPSKAHRGAQGPSGWEHHAKPLGGGLWRAESVVGPKQSSAWCSQRGRLACTYLGAEGAPLAGPGSSFMQTKRKVCSPPIIFLRPITRLSRDSRQQLPWASWINTAGQSLVTDDCSPKRKQKISAVGLHALVCPQRTVY